MSVTLRDRVAVVTGAGGGLGRAHAILLAQRGAKVVVNDLPGKDGQPSQADTVVDEIRAAGGQAVSALGSVSEPAAAKSIIDQAIDSFGRIDILVNNAGLLRDRSFIKMDLADFEAVVKVHLFGSAYCTHAAWPHMVEQKHGRVIVTTSVAGTNGNFGQANYAAAKMGLIGLANALSLEGKRNNVLVNAISPGAQTAMTEGLNPDFMVPLLKPELISALVAYLSSDECDVTGEVLWAAAGGYARMHYIETQGIQLDPREDVTPESIADNIDRIRDLTDPIPVVPGSFGRFAERLGSIGLWEG